MRMTIEIQNTSGVIGGLPDTGQRNVWQAVARGMGKRCPACGQGPVFAAYLKVRDACPVCGTELHHHRADDAPPYFTMVIVGHIVIAAVLAAERMYAPPTWLHLALWLQLTTALSLYLLPIVKGGLVGLQWALRMHGFGTGPDPAMPADIPAPGNHEGGR
jgi:uncharacterized protein (DUF983 family)